MNDSTLGNQDARTTISLRGVYSMIASLSGFTLIWAATDWRVALGLFVVLLANNMAHSVRNIE